MSYSSKKMLIFVTMESTSDFFLISFPRAVSVILSIAMIKEANAQVNVAVAIDALWRAIAKDFTCVIPRVVPNMVKTVQLIQGDGGLGSVFLFTFTQDTLIRSYHYQKERLAVCDETQHRFGLQVVEGGHLNHGFSSYGTFFKLTKIAEAETLVDVKVVYETEAEETRMPWDTTKASVGFIKCLEDYLLKQEL